MYHVVFRRRRSCIPAVFLCIATQFSCMQRFTIEFLLQQSILTVVQNTIPQATIAQVLPNCIYIPRFLYNYTSSSIYCNVCTYLLIENVYTTNLFCCQALSKPFPVFFFLRQTLITSSCNFPKVLMMMETIMVMD